MLTLNGALDVAGNPLGADLTHSGIDSGHDFDHDFGMNHLGVIFNRIIVDYSSGCRPILCVTARAGFVEADANFAL